MRGAATRNDGAMSERASKLAALWRSTIGPLTEPVTGWPAPGCGTPCGRPLTADRGCLRRRVGWRGRRSHATVRDDTDFELAYRSSYQCSNSRWEVKRTVRQCGEVAVRSKRYSRRSRKVDAADQTGWSGLSHSPSVSRLPPNSSAFVAVLTTERRMRRGSTTVAG